VESVIKILKRNWALFFGFVILIELVIHVGFTLVSFNKMIKAALDIIIFLIVLSILFFMQRELHKRTEELKEHKQKLKNIFDTLDVAIWSHDIKSDTLFITPGIEKLYGYSLEEFYKDKTLWKKVIVPEDLPIVSDRELRISLGEAVTTIYRIKRPDEEVRWIQDRGIPTLDDKGNFVDFNSVLFDITDRKESEERYRSLVEMSPDIIAVISRGRIDYINKAGCKLVGATSPEELIGQQIEKFSHTKVIEDMRIHEGTIVESQVIRLDGESIDVEMSTMPILYEGRLARQVVGRDITQRKKAEKTIQFMAYHDALTRLPNRYKFRQHLNEVLSQKRNQMLAVLFLDLDRFKIINDTKGHTTGDLLLQKVGKRLEETVQHDGMVSRQGGDEFIILLEDVNKEKTTQVAQRILDEFSNPIVINHQEYFITPSIGISIYPTDGDDEETLIQLADTAMYLAKERGKNNFQFYTSQLIGLSSRKMELENGLRKALEQDELTIYYQPQVELATGKIVGIEALTRWQHPKYGFISPLEFIPLAEETGLIVPLGKWVLRTACEQNKSWQDIGLQAIPIAINISVRQIQDDRFVDSVKDVLNQVGLDPRYLELEITESIMQNIEKSTKILNQLRDLGVTLSIDDFGTGYSSLSYLKHLPIDKIKIDKSFVDDIIYHSNQGAIVKTIIDMGSNLNFSVIAEGIETEEQVNFLIQNKCEIGQGFFFSRPLPAEHMEQYLIKGVV
jgi:diguanylate cyclase (GGDEF)-like protein/PAS domain S-box-containing protein